MLRGEHAGVQEDEHDDHPEHGLGLDGLAAGAAGAPVRLLQGLALLLPPGLGLALQDLVPSLLRLLLTRQFGCNSD